MAIKAASGVSLHVGLGLGGHVWCNRRRPKLQLGNNDMCFCMKILIFQA